jgi:DNA polymerase III subunit epsilon
MIDWLKNAVNKYPEFWKEYSLKFNEKSIRFVVLNIETNGLDKNTSEIVSIGAIAVNSNSIIVNDNFQISLKTDKKIDDFKNLEIEYENKLMLEKEPKSIQLFIEYLGNAVLVGHRIAFDVDILNKYLEKQNFGRLKNEALDVEVMYKKLEDINNKQFTLDDLLKIFKIEKSERYSASEDAYSIALLFLKLKSRLGIL